MSASKRRDCPLCATRFEAPFLERRDVPVHQNVLLPSAEAARSVARGDLVLARCPSCDFVSNVAFDDALTGYGDTYENEQTFSPAFEAYVDGLVERLVSLGVAGGRVVEVGCGSGTFLRKLCERGANEGVGFDASYRGAEVDGPVRFVRDYYGPRYADEHADGVVCRHVIEHVADPAALLSSVVSAASPSGALVAFETPDLEWILDHVVFQDLFYEHCSYFSRPTLDFAFRMAGIAPETHLQTFGRQYQWIEGHPGPADTSPPGGPLGAAVDRYVNAEATRLDDARARVEALADGGPVAVWGAGAKGVTFLNLVDPAGAMVTGVVDLNPHKHGRFVAGTGHPIFGPREIAERGIRAAVLMNPNYGAECRRLVDELGIAVELHDLDDSPRSAVGSHWGPS